MFNWCVWVAFQKDEHYAVYNYFNKQFLTRRGVAAMHFVDDETQFLLFHVLKIAST